MRTMGLQTGFRAEYCARRPFTGAAVARSAKGVADSKTSPKDPPYGWGFLVNPYL